MSNEDRILKYFSGTLSPEEKKVLEKDMLSSPEIKAEYEKIEKMLSSLRNDAEVEIEDKYFVNLVPEVRERMAAKKKVFSIPKFAAVLPVIIILFVLIFRSGTDQYNSTLFSINEYTDTINNLVESASAEQLNEFIDISESYSNNNFEVFNGGLEINELKINVDNNYTLDEFDKYELLDELNEDEMNDIYNKLLNTKIL